MNFDNRTNLRTAICCLVGTCLLVGLGLGAWQKALIVDLLYYPDPAQGILHADLSQSNEFYWPILLVILSICVIVVGILGYYWKKIQQRNCQLIARENAFQLLVEHMEDTYLLYSLSEHRFIHISESLNEILGLSIKQVYNQADIFFSCLLPEDRILLRQTILHVMEIKKGQHLECAFQTPSGEAKWVCFHVQPIDIFDKNWFLLAITDLTTQKKNQDLLKAALVKAQEAGVARRDFLSQMSHEIRTPMNAIAGLIKMAEHAIDDPDKLQDCLHKMNLSSDHLLTLVNDILDFSKIESGKMELVKEPFSFKELVQAICSMVNTQAKEKGVFFATEAYGLNKESLVGDTLRLKQVLLNLLSNAIKYTPTGGHITFSIRQIAEDVEQVRLRFAVKDDGIGMSETFLQTIFLPFAQATQKGSGSTGLGLAITKDLITLMNGNITVESKLGVGSTFTVDLPLAVDNKEVGIQKAFSFSSKEKILIWQQDTTIACYLVKVLNSLNCSAQYCSNQEEILLLLEQAKSIGYPYTFCLLDFPREKAASFLQAIRCISPTTAMRIFLSVYDITAVAAHILPLVDGCITKPLFSSDLLAIIENSKNVPGICQQKENTFDFSHCHILLAEDNVLNMEIALDFLNQTGARVDCAENGEAVCEAFLNSPVGYYNFILMDVQMPRMDGYAATEKIRQSKREDATKVIIIAMTANAFREDREESLACGMDDHIAKPINFECLFEKMKEHLIRDGEDEF